MRIDFDELLRPPGGTPPGAPRRWWALVAAGLGLFLATGVGVEILTDAWWFDSLGQLDVLRTRLVASVGVFLAATALGALWLAVNWRWAARRVAAEAVWPGQAPPVIGRQGAGRLVSVAAVFVAALLALAAAAAWPTLVLFRAQADFGVADPLFGRDVAFYVFTLPVLRLARGLAAAWTGTAFVGAAVLYGIGGLLELRRGSPRVPVWVRAHLTILAAVGVLVWSVGFWLARFDLLLADRPGSSFFGPGYADVAARLVGLQALAVAGIVAAGALVVAARRGGLVAPVAVVGALAVLRIALVDVVPSVVQRYRVEPNELAVETPFIAHNIEMTRRAFGIGAITETEYEPSVALGPELAATGDRTVRNVRLWDWRTLLDTLRGRQGLRPYYEFLDVDVDRYALADGQRQVELAARELEPARVPNQTWVNLHLAYTHGYGLSLVPVDEVDATGTGQPVFWVGDIPVISRPPFDVEITQPRIYFGEGAGDRYVIVGTKADEFDYPVGAENARTAYSGADGVPIGSRLRRLAFAMRFGDSEILVSEALTPESRLLMVRDVVDRVRALAPFLVLDPDPYLTISAGGRLVWLLDAYTATDRYPYAQPVRSADPGLADLAGQNYVRNSVKVAIDAYDGQPTFYVVDPDEPLIAAWSRVFPSLFAPGDTMPPDLVAHWRYPEALFRAQATIYARYHVTSPEVFYNAEDLWALPSEMRSQENGQRPLEPYYVTLRLRGEAEPEFVLMLPFTPAGKPNMVAWLAARSDPEHYGELVAYDFAKGELVFGPQQIESRIDQVPEISSQLSLWDQRGSQTIRGNLLVIPIGDAILYVEPLYLQAESGSLPELKRVIVADGQHVVMRPTLEEAIAALVGGASPDGGPAADETAPAGGPATGASGAAPDVASLVASAVRHKQAAFEAAGAGDLTTFGREMAALSRDLDALARLTGTEPPDLAPPDATSGDEARATPTPGEGDP